MKYQENCSRCGKFLGKTDCLLCDECYEEFIKWSFRRFSQLASQNENLIELWLKEDKKNELEECPVCHLMKKLYPYGSGKLCHECIMDMNLMKRRNLES